MFAMLVKWLTIMLESSLRLKLEIVSGLETQPALLTLSDAPALQDDLGIAGSSEPCRVG